MTRDMTLNFALLFGESPDHEVKSAHRELPHHASIFVFQDVAVIHIRVLLGRGMIESNSDFRPIVIIQHHHIFPTLLIRRCGCTFHLFDQE